MSNETVLAKLVVTFPDGNEQTFAITQTPFDIGRVPANGLQLPDSKVSRHHARLMIEGDRLSLLDLNSRNFTFVGGNKLAPNEPYGLAYGETFTLGPYSLRLEAAPAPEPAVEAKSPGPVAAEAELISPPEGEPAVEDAEEPPRPPSPPDSHIFENGSPNYDAIFGLPADHSRYLQYLPPIYHEHPFLSRFLLSFEGVLTPVEQAVDNFDLYLDPFTAPEFFLKTLAGWLDLTLDEKWSLAKRRAVVAEAAELYRCRGTRRGLTRYLQLYTDLTPQIIEPEDKPHHFNVTLRLAAGQFVDRATVERIIQANKPAHATYSLEIVRS